ncbi:MAG: hypothetical protein JW810_06660 [Sedimentisphaerales bacterium]|nr:hypothetical protein [Sedimentisphaerales bacterium]
MKISVMRNMAVLGAAGLFLLAGCTTTDLLQTYQVGQEQQVRYTLLETHWQWVEMPDEPPSQRDGREIKNQIVWRQQVEAVHPDGSATLKVTLESLDLSMHTVLPDKDRTSYYRSSADKTESSITNAPKLAGAEYRIRQAPDSTLLEIIGLDELRKELGMTPEDQWMAPRILTEETLKELHEHPFLKSHVRPGQTLVKMEPVPHVMIKAQALETTYKAGSAEKRGNQELVTVTSTAEPIHTLPQGWDEPPAPGDPSRTMIKSMFDMQKLEVTDQGVYDLTGQRVQSDNRRIFCSLILLEEKIFKGGPNARKKEKWGEMFAEITKQEQYQVMP